jgi:hypothetical protein
MMKQENFMKWRPIAGDNPITVTTREIELLRHNISDDIDLEAICMPHRSKYPHWKNMDPEVFIIYVYKTKRFEQTRTTIQNGVNGITMFSSMSSFAKFGDFEKVKPFLSMIDNSSEWMASNFVKYFPPDIHLAEIEEVVEDQPLIVGNAISVDMKKLLKDLPKGNHIANVIDTASTDGVFSQSMANCAFSTIYSLINEKETTKVDLDDFAQYASA